MEVCNVLNSSGSQRCVICRREQRETQCVKMWLSHKMHTGWKRRTHRQKWALIIWIVAVTVLFYVFMDHSYTEYRCASEVLKIQNTAIAFNQNKSELIAEFIRIYDVELRDGDRGDAHLLPERLATCRQVHPDSTRDIGRVLHWLSTARITHAYGDERGNQKSGKWFGSAFKLFLTLEGGYKVMFKVKRKELDEMTVHVRHLQTERSTDRHNAEIASYHLQRILGFNRAPFVVGRKVNFMKEILPVADDYLRDAVYQNGSQTCLHFCIRGDHKFSCFGRKLEGVMILWLPRALSAQKYRNPFKFTKLQNYLHPDQLTWPLWAEQGKLMDAIDALVLDYLIQNLDRHIYYFEPVKYSSLLLLDHGKGFSHPYIESDRFFEEFEVRCQIRDSTYERLKLLRGGVLSAVLRHILSRDPTAPVLWEPYYAALDRRLELMLNVIDKCIAKHTAAYVLVPDELPLIQQQNRLWLHAQAFLHSFQTLYAYPQPFT